MLRVNPNMLPRLDELEADLHQRRERAISQGWLGEIEGIDLTLRFLKDKRDQTKRLMSITRQVNLATPTIRR
jgi:hypothetical protein